MSMDMCELCKKKVASQMLFGVHLCTKCRNDFGMVMKNDADMVNKFANEANFPDASVKARNEMINFAKRKLESGVELNNVKSQEKETNSQTNHRGSKEVNAKEADVTKITQSSRREKTQCYKLKYEKVLSISEKREWIEDYVNIKRFVSGFYTVLGLGVGFILGRIFEYGWDVEMMVLLFIGGAAGGIFGRNSVGTAMMQAITAEQSIVNEEILTEILNKLYEEEEKKTDNK